MRNHRLPLGIVALLLVSSAQAQQEISQAMQAAVKAGVDRKLLPSEASGFPPRGDKYSMLPPTNAPEGKLKFIHADSTEQHGSTMHWDGNVEFLARGYHVLADKVVGNTTTMIFTLTGNVQVQGADSYVIGDEITVDFNNQTYVATNAESQLKPKVVGGPVRGDIYVKGEKSYGTSKQITAQGGDLTTCDKPDPHFDIYGQNTNVIPGKRAIFRHAKIRLFGHTVLRLAYLVIPLDDRTYKYLPDVGKSPDEGYYIKNRYSVPLKGLNYLETREDYMSKLGTGLGLGYIYSQANSSGTTRLYHIFGATDTLSLTNEHNQKFNWGTLALTNDFEKDNYLVSPGSTLWNARAFLTIPTGPSATEKVTLTRNSSDTNGFSTLNQSIAVQDTRSLSPKTKTDLNINWLDNKSTYSSGDPVERQEMDVKFQGSQDLTQATAQLDYQRAIPIGQIRNFYSSSDQTPVISLLSDAKRLFGDKMQQALPFKTQVSLGEFNDPTGSSHLTRSMFDFQVQKPGTPQKDLSSDVTARFRQSLYSDDTAQYLLDLNSTTTYKIGKVLSSNFRYSYLRPYGYSPLQIDRTGQSNLASADLSLTPSPTFKIGAQTSYDMMQLAQGNEPWTQLSVRMEYTPWKQWIGRGQLAYDTYRHSWSNLQFDVNGKKGGTTLSLGTRFDGLRHQWSNVNVYLDGIQVGRTRLSTILNYNGYTKQFDSAQYSLIYDLHCAEALFTVLENNTGFRTGRTFQFSIRLKALPSMSNFGTGTGGQSIGTGTGRSL